MKVKTTKTTLSGAHTSRRGGCLLRDHCPAHSSAMCQGEAGRREGVWLSSDEEQRGSWKEA